MTEYRPQLKDCFYKLTCIYCGKMIVKRMSNAKSCDDCKIKRSKEKNRQKLIKSREYVTLN